jgi:hypothetical protein
VEYPEGYALRKARSTGKTGARETMSNEDIIRMVLGKLCYDGIAFAAIARHNYRWMVQNLLDFDILPNYIHIAKPALKALLRWVKGKKMRKVLKPYTENLTRFRNLVEKHKIPRRDICKCCINQKPYICKQGTYPRFRECRYFWCLFSEQGKCGGEAYKNWRGMWITCPNYPKCLLKGGTTNG